MDQDQNSPLSVAQPDQEIPPHTPSSGLGQDYQVLARKYRPRHFQDLIGQEALVRTLSNAIDSGRIAHAFMLTGIRGVGKTTTARIIAKALNYKGADGQGQPFTGDTQDCPVCCAIAQDRHPDVMEMDAASRTGIDDIRELLDGVRYAPVEARYKIYIIDEVHMLSKNAFNALLKTLEEPPPHVKFIFATTEIRKVPVTILSRCQRFDLRRVDVSTLIKYYADIAQKEQAEIDTEALNLIARAADGSVRDGLSLLDQAIALCSGSNSSSGSGTITGAQIRDMLGLADRHKIMDILEHITQGKIALALDMTSDLYQKGADPLVLIQDLLELSYRLMRLKMLDAPESHTEHNVFETTDLAERGRVLSETLSIPALGRMWQILLKSLNDVQTAPIPQHAAEMCLMRLVYTADLPDPLDLVRKLDKMHKGESIPPQGAIPHTSREERGMSHTSNQMPPPSHTSPKHAHSSSSSPSAHQGQEACVSFSPQTDQTPNPIPCPDSIPNLVALLHKKGAHILAGQVFQYVRPVRLKKGRLDFEPAEQTPADLAHNLARGLQEITGERWVISVCATGGQPSLAEAELLATQSRLARARAHPDVENILTLFPEAKIIDVIKEGENPAHQERSKA